MKKILVTGGAGFIGSHVVDLLIKFGYEVIVVDDLSTGSRHNVNPEAQLVIENCGDLNEGYLEGNTIVIHCAYNPRCNVSLYTPEADVQKNYLPSLQFLKRCVNSKIKRFVLISSLSVYGDVKDLPYTEDQPPQPLDPYAIHKYALEKIALTSAKVAGLDVIILRPQHVFGPRQRADLSYRNVLARWSRKALMGQSLPVFGTLELRRAFSPVSLIARGIVAAALTDGISEEIINLGSRNVRSLKEIAELISSISKKKVTFEILPSPPTLKLYAFGDVSKAENLLAISEEEGEFTGNLESLINEIISAPKVNNEKSVTPEIFGEDFDSIYSIPK